jgi:hypothetical protein
VETAAFLEYLDEHRSTSGLGESVRDLIALRRALARRRALAQLGALVPVPVPVDPPRRVRRAS